MGFLSKLWKGVKKTVKKVARSVKKVAKKVAHSIPGGKQLWKLGTKIGKDVMEGFSKVAGALGPVGMMALSFVLAPVMGPLVSQLWAGFGAGATAMAGSANAIVAGLGQAGTAIFNGVNFVSGTVGAMGDAISKGVGELAKGNLGSAGKVFADNMTQAFTGEAGKAGIQAGIEAATSAADKSLWGTVKETAGGIKDTFSMTQDPAPVSEITSGVRDTITPKNTGLEGMQLDLGGTETVDAGNFLQASQPGAEKSLMSKTLEAGRKAAGILGSGGEPVEVSEGAGYDPGLQRTDISAPGQAQAIQAVGGSDQLWAQLINQAGRTA